MPDKGNGMWRSDRRAFLKVAGASVGGSVILPPGSLAAAEDDYPDLARLRRAHENAGIVSPEKTYRTMEWEFHTPPQADFRIDVEGAVKAARDAGAESLMFYTQSHWGYALYPSDWRCASPIWIMTCSGKRWNSHANTVFPRRLTTACSSTTNACSLIPIGPGLTRPERNSSCVGISPAWILLIASMS